MKCVCGPSEEHKLSWNHKADADACTGKQGIMQEVSLFACDLGCTSVQGTPCTFLTDCSILKCSVGFVWIIATIHWCTYFL